MTETFAIITGLEPGKNYTISITAVADDGRTGGDTRVISQYTSKCLFNFGLNCEMINRILNI